MRQALGFPADTDNPRKLRDSRDGDRVKRIWTGVRWLGEGYFEDQIKPLPQESGLLPLRQHSIMDYRQHGDSNPSDPGKGVEDQKGRVDANEDHVDGNVAATDDHENDITPADSSTVDFVDDIDDKVISRVVSLEKVTKEDQLRTFYVKTPDPGIGYSSDRQHGNIDDLGSIPASDHVSAGQTGGLTGVVGSPQGLRPAGRFSENPAPIETLVFDLEGRSANGLYTTTDPVDFVQLSGIAEPGRPPRLLDRSATVVDYVKQSLRVIGHNIVRFDIPALSRIDPKIDILGMARERRLFDTMIADSVLNPIMNDDRSGAVGRAMKHFALDASAERHGVPGKMFDLNKFVKREHGGDFNAVDWSNPELREYCLGDVAATRAVYDKLDRKHRSQAATPMVHDYLWREHRVHAIASVMSMNGFTVNEPLLRERHAAGVARKKALTATLVDHYDIPTVKADGKPATSPAATKEGKEALAAALASLGVDVERDITRTAKGAISYGGDSMRELAAMFEDRPNGEAIAALCEVIADSAGIRTIYGTAIEHLHRHPDGTVKVHPSVATFQASGRWSVTKPGLTVFGKHGGRVVERAIFTAGPGHVLMAIDLAQVDARAVAGHCQDREYMKLFDPGRDSHRDVAEMVWGTRDDEHRQLAKAIGHGWNYGMGVPKLARQAKVSEDVARQFDTAMKKKFPRLVEWKAEIVDQASKGGYLDNGFGRLMRPNPERAYTQGPALMGQGTAREIMMDCLLDIDDRIPDVIHMLRVQVHDEAVFEIPEEIANDVKPFIEACFAGEFKGVPILADGGKFAQSWAECY
jgi:DNA polymerase-1